MADLVRAFSPAGIERFRAFLAALRAGSPEDPPWALLEDPQASVALSAEAWVERQRFGSRWGVGEYLWRQLASLPAEEVEGNRGLWTWLALYFFDQVCPLRADARRKPGQDYRHVPDFGYRYRYRHLLYGPYAVYRRHRGYAILVLSGPLHMEQSIYHEITSRTDLIASRGVLDALNALYLDRARGLPKRNAQTPSLGPGALRRFVRVLQQLDVTYDVYGMTGQAILDLLPAEFDAWRGEVALLA
ncbi:MAG: hypothetical protein HC814_00015 [Rhodobacteraceae bacterium]|nr:hypothetical protein [Paracoccaceae bacterium]